MPVFLTQGPNLLQQRIGGGPGLPPVLLNHPTQSSIAIDGWRAALFGLPFLVAGTAIICAALDLFPTHKHAPNGLVGIIGAIFFCAGAFVFTHGIRGLIKRAAYRREAAQYSGQPWLIDFHWNKEGANFSAFKSMLGRLMAALVWTAFLVPFFWIGLKVRGAWPFLVFSSIFALLGLIFWTRWAQMLGELIRYGNSFLAYDDFPYFLGGSLHARLRAPNHVSALQELTLTLRCVQEKYVTTGTGKNRQTQVVCYELYSDVVTLDGDRVASFAGGDIPIAFALPADKSTTTLADSPPTYWEIEARGKAPGADYEAYFLVPVYKRN